MNKSIHPTRSSHLKGKRHFASNLMSVIASNTVLEQAKAFIFQQRQHDSANSDLWDVCLRWEDDKVLIQQQLLSGCYQLSPVQVFGSRDGYATPPLDKMIPPDCAYARYRDDWVILTRTRRQLRQMVKNMHDVVHRLKLKLAPNKTFIGGRHEGHWYR
jgi:hypothetical protein